MLSKFILILVLGSSIANAGKPNKCNDRKVHFSGGGKDYHFSWKDSADKEFTWQQGRKYCQNICMDLASIQTQSDWDTLLEIFNTGAPRIQIQTESEYQTT